LEIVKSKKGLKSGIVFVAIFAAAAVYLSKFVFFTKLGISPLIIGIVLGMIFANKLKDRFLQKYNAGIVYSTRTILRLGIVLYGFRLTLQNVQDIGFFAVLVSITIIFSTFSFGYFLGTKVLKIDKEITILTCAGSSICGAAAVLAAEPVVGAKSYKSAIAVSTVVLFGTISMFLYPFLYKLAYIPFDKETMGIFIGATLHEVAHVVGAGNAISDVTSSTAIIVKMIRVMLLAPFLIILSFFVLKGAKDKVKNKKTQITIPWFAVLFIIVVCFNSLNFLPDATINTINYIDTFLLTMAMFALGMETSFDKFKNVGFKLVLLAFILFLWLIFGGFTIVNYFV